MTTPRIPIPPTGPLTAPLRSQLHAALLSSSAIGTIHNTLLHESQATGWLDALRARVQDLLRSGECATYGEVMAVLLREIKGNGRADGTGAFVKREHGGKKHGGGKHGGGNGVNGVNGGGRGSLMVPEKVVEVGVRVVRGFLDEVVDIEGVEKEGV